MASAGAQPTPQPAPAEPPAQTADVSWEGDRMFNVYIYDYCNKRGFRKTARELRAEAALDLDSRPPIDAKQGLLYEWWSVFWVLFTAKNGNGNGSEDAQIYVEHQRNHARMQPPPPGQAPPPAGRYINGVPPRQGPPGAMPPNMNMPNGVGTPAPPTAGQPNMPNGVPGVPFPPPNGPNGAHAGVPGPSPPQAAQPFPAHMLPPGARPGQPQQPGQPLQRGVPNYHSPTMASSPQGSQPPQPGQPGQQVPLAPGPSPRMMMARTGMPPPPGAHGPPGMQQPPTPSFQPPGARPPSRPNTPGKMMQSPSMAARFLGNQPMNITQIEGEYSRLTPGAVMALKQEANIEKDMPSLTIEDKARIVNLFYKKRLQGSMQVGAMRPGMPMHPNAVAGPSGMQPGAMQPPAQRLPQGPQPPQQVPPRAKRSSTSPGEEDATQAESSPPDRKRLRTSPNGEQGASQPPFPPQPMAAPGAPGGGPPPGMMRMVGPPGMNPFPGMPSNMQGNPGMFGQHMGAPVPHQAMHMMQGMGPPGGQMGTQPMNPALGGPQAGGMNRNTLQQYKEQVGNWHKMAPAAVNAASPATPSEATTPNNATFGLDASGNLRPPGQQFTPVLPNRMAGPQGGKPGLMGPPPPSPGQKPPGAKDGPAPSPQMGAAGAPQPGMPGAQGGTNPPTPVPGQQGIKAPSPSQILSGSGGLGGPVPGGPGAQAPPPSAAPGGGFQPDLGANLFPPGNFMDSIVQSLDEGSDVDAFNLFGPRQADGDLNFERDFAEWFNPGEDALMMK